MKDWITWQFEEAGLSFHQGKPKNDSSLNPLLKLLSSFGFEIRDLRGGSHIVVYHPELEGWTLAPTGIVTLPIKHSGSQNKPMVKAHYVDLCLKAVKFLHQKGVI